jgi:putative oxidoreductase
MKIAALIARYLLGIVFVVVGLNGLVPFLPQPPMEGLTAQFVGALVASHYMTVVFVIQIIGGILLLANRYVPLALTLLGPVIFNIVLFHITMDHSGLPRAFFVTILWIIVALNVRSAFEGILRR